jgi:membrane protein
VALLIGATTVFAELKNAMDRIWRCPAGAHESGLFNLLRTRLLSLGLILGMGFLMIVSLIASAALAALNSIWNRWLGDWIPIAQWLNDILQLATIACLFAMIYKWMPRVRLQWRDVWIGAGITALLFAAGKWMIGLYIAHSAVASGFGAAASLIVIVVWVYYSAQIFLLGAEFTRAFAHRLGSRRGQGAQLPRAPEVPVRRAGPAREELPSHGQR